MCRLWKTLVFVVLLLSNVLPSYATSRVEFKHNRLKVDGKAFFFYGCWGTPNNNYSEFRRRYFNTAFVMLNKVAKEGPKAAAAGLMVIPYPYAPGWNKRAKNIVGSIADKDWVLAWDIGDDLHTKEDLEAALRVRNQIMRIDVQHRPIMLDAYRLHLEFAKIADLWCIYDYPLLKPTSPHLFPGASNRLTEYGNHLLRERLLAGPHKFFWTWVQCHPQVWYTEKYLGGTKGNYWRPSRFPDGGELRLLAAHAISAGCRGLMWFMYRYFQDDHFGRDRYDRAAVIGAELDVLGPLIAQGTIGQRLPTSDPSVWATPIDFPGGRLICLLKNGKYYQYRPDAGQAKGVEIKGLRAGAKVFQIGYNFKQLSEPRCSFYLTSWLLVTKDQSLIQTIRERHKAVLPDMARFAVDELRAHIDKAKPIFQQLGKGSSALEQTHGRLKEARKLLDAKRWSEAGSKAEQGLAILRAAQYLSWRGVWTSKTLPNASKVPDFYLLPLVAKAVESSR